MRRATGLQRRVRAAELHPAAVRLPVQAPGPLLRVAQLGRPAHHRARQHHQGQGADAGQDVRARCRGTPVQGAQGLVLARAAERQDGQVALPGHLSLRAGQDQHARGTNHPRPADVRQRAWHPGVRHGVRQEALVHLQPQGPPAQIRA